MPPRKRRRWPSPPSCRSCSHPQVCVLLPQCLVAVPRDSGCPQQLSWAKTPGKKPGKTLCRAGTSSLCAQHPAPAQPPQGTLLPAVASQLLPALASALPWLRGGCSLRKRRFAEVFLPSVSAERGGFRGKARRDVHLGLHSLPTFLPFWGGGGSIPGDSSTPPVPAPEEYPVAQWGGLPVSLGWCLRGGGLPPCPPLG